MRVRSVCGSCAQLFSCWPEFLQALADVRTKDGWKVLIVDDESMRNISACCGYVACAVFRLNAFPPLASRARARSMYDIMEKGVTLVEPVYLAREPQPSMDAVYYLSPTPASVDAVIRDFDNNDDQYAGVHLLFTKRLPDDLFAKVCAFLFCPPRSLTHSFSAQGFRQAQAQAARFARGVPRFFGLRAACGASRHAPGAVEPV